MKNINYGTLVFYKERQSTHRWRQHSQNSNPVPCPLNQIPPFQLEFPGFDVEIIDITLVRLEDDFRQPILNNLRSAGLEQFNSTHPTLANRTVFLYRANVPIPQINALVGMYQIRLRTTMNEYWSERFVMKSHFVRHIYMEWCHAEDLELPDQLIHYPGRNYKNFTWFYSDINYPRYEYEQQVETRNSKEFPLVQTSYKVFRFHTVLSEYYMDIMRLVPLHDYVAIEHLGTKYKLDSVLVTPTELEGSRIAGVEIEMRFDTVTTVAARGVTSIDECKAATGQCYVTELSVIKCLIDNSNEIRNRFYYDLNGNRVPFVNGDRFLLKQKGGTTVIKEEQDGTYITVDVADGSYIYSEYEGAYAYVDNGGEIRLNELISVDADNDRLTYSAIPGTIVEVCILNKFDQERCVAVTEGLTDLVKEETIAVDFLPTEDVAVKLKFSNSACGTYYETQWEYFEFISDDASDIDFGDDVDARNGGIAPGQAFPVSENNCWGVPAFFMKELDPETVYYDDNHAMVNIGLDRAYAMSPQNPYGVPSCNGLLRIIPFKNETYNNDTEAINAGLNQGDKYIVNGLNYGYSGYFIKQIE